MPGGHAFIKEKAFIWTLVYLSGVTRRVTFNQFSQSSCDEGHVFRSFWEGQAEWDEWLSSTRIRGVQHLWKPNTVLLQKNRFVRNRGRLKRISFWEGRITLYFHLVPPPLPFLWVPWVCQHRKFLVSLEYSLRPLTPSLEMWFAFSVDDLISCWVTEWTTAGANLRKESR